VNFDTIFFESYQAINSFIIVYLDVFFTKVSKKKKKPHIFVVISEKNL
jgi:hypothetical protein